MPIRIKNWERFQHYRGRRPPWIKLYRDLLDDHDWHLLPPPSAKMLVSLWLIASESDGELPGVETLAFRLRTTPERITTTLATLEHWVVQDASSVLAACKQDAMPETETETETDKIYPSSATPMAFDRFWKAYPRKVGKGAARKAWAAGKLDAKLDAILAAVSSQAADRQWREEGGRFIPHPATWLRHERWEDEGVSAPPPPPEPSTADQERHAKTVREIEAAVKQAIVNEVAPGDADRAIEALRDKYRDQPTALREAFKRAGVR